MKDHTAVGGGKSLVSFMLKPDARIAVIWPLLLLGADSRGSDEA